MNRLISFLVRCFLVACLLSSCSSTKEKNEQDGFGIREVIYTDNSISKTQTVITLCWIVSIL